MPTLIAATAGQADSADVVVAAGSNPTFLLNAGASDVLPINAVALIQAKTGTNYVTVGQIDSLNNMKVLAASGTFRVRKLASVGVVGVDQN